MSSAPASGYPANPLLIRRDAYRHWERERVRWSDTDQIGHTNNLAFGAYCETGRSLFMKHFLDGARDARQMFLLTQIVINFVGELHWPAEVAIGTGVLSIGRTSCRLGQGLFDGERCFGSSEALLVLIDEQTRRPRPIPDDVRDWLAGYRLA
ncbi:MAG: thioesterase family protein [Nevskia sp.]